MYILSLLVYAACFLNIGLDIYVLIYYVPVDKRKIKENIRWHTLIVSVSYMMLEMSSIIGFSFLHGVLFGIWILLASVLGTASLVFIFRNAVLKKKRELIAKEENHDYKI